MIKIILCKNANVTNLRKNPIFSITVNSFKKQILKAFFKQDNQWF